MNDFIHRVPSAVLLYEEGDLEGLDLQCLGQYLTEKTHIPSKICGNIYSGLPEYKIEAMAKEYAKAKVKDPGRELTRSTAPESRPSGLGRVRRSGSTLSKTQTSGPGVEGLMLGEPLQGEWEYERRRIQNPQWRIFGILYDGGLYHKVISGLINKGEIDFDHCAILFTNQLFGTWDQDDRRYHARVSLYGFPNLISTSGLVEAPAKPKEFYLKKQMGVPVELLKEEYQDRFLDHGDPRMTEALKGYAMQAVFFHLAGNPFCEDPDCRLFNSHWQEEVLHSQLDGRYEFCPKHETILKELRERSI